MVKKILTIKNLCILVLQICFLLTGIFFINSNSNLNNTVFASSGTPELSYTLINGGTAYEVSKGLVLESITEIVIPNTYNDIPVIQIASSGFNGLANLQDVTIPSGVTTIGSYAFRECTSLVNIVLPNSVTRIDSYAFYKCTSLTNIVIPESVTIISSAAFRDCTSLTTVFLPNSLRNITGSAFQNCTNLTNIETNSTIKQIDGTSGLYVINASGNAVTTGGIAVVTTSGTTHTLVTATGAVTSLIIPNTVTAIGGSAFYQYTSLISVVIPNSVTSIGTSSFSLCSSLTSVVIPNSVTSIGNSAFYACSNLTEVTLPSSLTSIGTSAFRDTSSLINIKTDTTAKQTDGTNGLYVIDASGNAVTTGGLAVVIVSELGASHTIVTSAGTITSIVIPNTVTTISGSAFMASVNLTSVTIPASVITIGPSVFSSSSNLARVIMLGETPATFGTNVFSNTNANLKIIVPVASVDAYKTASGWTVYADKIVGEFYYLVIFKNYNESVIDIQTITSGNSAVAPLAPVKPSDVQLTYEFAGWDANFYDITNDLTVNAMYNESAVQYTVTFKNWDGSEIENQLVDYGSDAVAPSDPVRAATAQYSYTFSGWDVDFSNITGDLTVTATYEAVVNEYTVRFKNWDDSEIENQLVEYGSGAVAPSDPVRAATAQYSYIFSGWDVDFSNITGDLTVTATYEAVVNKFEVVFKNYNGDVLDTQLISYGESAIAPVAPSKPTDIQHTYEFAGWDVEYSNITSNIIITAVYTPTLRAYIVTFDSNGGTQVEAQEVTNGNLVVAPTNPTNPGVRFGGWFKEATLENEFDFENDFMPTQNITLYASWLVNVTIVADEEESSVELKQNNENSDLNAIIPIKIGHTFAYFLYNEERVTEQTQFNYSQEIVLTAVFTVNSYVISFNTNGSNVLISNKEVVYGQVLGELPIPTKDGYKFKGWFVNNQKVTSQTVFTYPNNITLLASWQDQPASIIPFVLAGAAVAAIVTLIASLAIVIKRKFRQKKMQANNTNEILMRIKDKLDLLENTNAKIIVEKPKQLVLPKKQLTSDKLQKPPVKK